VIKEKQNLMRRQHLTVSGVMVQYDTVV